MNSLRSRIVAESIIEILLATIVLTFLLIAALNTGEQKMTRAEIAFGTGILLCTAGFLVLCGFKVVKLRLAGLDRGQWSVQEDVVIRRSLIGGPDETIIRFEEVLYWRCRRDLPLIGKIWEVRLILAPDETNGMNCKKPFWMKGFRNYRYFRIYPLDLVGKNDLVGKLEGKSKRNREI